MNPTSREATLEAKVAELSRENAELRKALEEIVGLPYRNDALAHVLVAKHALKAKTGASDG